MFNITLNLRYGPQTDITLKLQVVYKVVVYLSFLVNEMNEKCPH